MSTLTTLIIYFSCILLGGIFDVSDETFKNFFEYCFDSFKDFWDLIKIYFLKQKYIVCEQPYGFYDFRNAYVKDCSSREIFEFNFTKRLLFKVDNISLTYMELLTEEVLLECEKLKRTK